MMRAGHKISLDGGEYTVPPLTLGQLRNGALEKLREHDELVANSKPYEAFILRGEVILSCLKKNHPDFQDEILWDNLDVSSLGAIWLAVLGLSGFTGENPAVVTAPSGTSSPSTEA